MKIHHLNCGLLHVPPGPQAACHCLLLEHAGRLALVDTGIGLQDIARPTERIGQAAIEAAGVQFHESLTAARQIESLGWNTGDVDDIVLTHADPDHAGGLADFPAARVHISQEEFTQLGSESIRYSAAQFAHGPRWHIHSAADAGEPWFVLEARPVQLSSGADVLLVPLFGHTLGHCGVAVRSEDRWLLHVGDAYYLRAELATDDHPVSQLAAMRADDDGRRRASLEELRRLAREHSAEVELCGYHDFSEFPSQGR
ncbi:MAG: MBL fold metallo-hydrolase [Pirellulales bacterium]